MYTQGIEEVIRSLVVALMNGTLYFTKHPRVLDSVENAVKALDDCFQNTHQVRLWVKEGLLINEEVPLFDLSLFAHKLTKALTDHNGKGFCIHRGVTTEELGGFIEFLLEPLPSPDAEGNDLLRQRGIRNVTLEKEEISEGTASEEMPSSKASLLKGEQTIPRDLYTKVMEALQDILLELRRDGSASFDAANDLAEEIANTMTTNRLGLLRLTAVKCYDTYTFNHSINVCIYTTAVADLLTTKPKEKVQIAQAALLHDVGKLLVDDSILFKPGRLTEEEMSIMRQHPQWGAKILVEAKGVHNLAVNAAFGHHLRFDGTGYPELSEDVTIDPVTDFIHIADVYEAFTATRPYKDAFPPTKAAALLLRGAGSEYNPVCVEAFLQVFGAYPPGTQVSLDNGMKGLVTNTNPENPLRPLVEVTHDSSNLPCSSEGQIDTAEKNSKGEYCCSIVECLT